MVAGKVSTNWIRSDTGSLSKRGTSFWYSCTLKKNINPCQRFHSHFDLGVHVPLGFSIWGYRSLFEGTHILGELTAL